MTIAVSADSLDVTIKGKEILKDIRFSLQEGRFLGIVGPNGGGKTTLVRVILGLISPSSGTVKVFGDPPAQLHHGESIFGYLPQHLNIDPHFPANALDVVLMGRYGKAGVFRWPGRHDREFALACMDMLGVSHLSAMPFHQLSGGQQQRISIARALAGEPKILILDEPSTGIDVVGQEDFYHLLKGLQKRMNLTILMVSHDIGTVTTYVDEIACLNIHLYYHGNPLGALNEKVLASLYGKNVDLLMHTDICDKCERLR